MKNSILAISIAGILASGCASITKPKHSTVQLRVPQSCDEKIDCQVANKKGTWGPVRAPGEVTFRKSDDPLRVSCEDENGKVYHQETLEGQRGGMEWGNIVFGGIVGGVVDSHTDAHWNYPDHMKIPCPKPG